VVQPGDTVVLQMPRPQRHPKSGVYRTRVAVPYDLRETVGKAELIESLGTKDRAEAAGKHLTVYARMVATLAAAREEQGGVTRGVTPREIAAMAGEVYRAGVATAEANPGKFSDRNLDLDDLLDRLTGNHGDGVEDERSFDPAPPDLDEARQFLRARGIAADADSVQRMAKEIWSARVAAAHVAIRRARGDWTPDPDASRFPKMQPPAPPTVPQVPSRPTPATEPGVRFGVLMADFARERPQQRKTLDKRNSTLDSLVRSAGHNDARQITKADVLAWKRHRLEEGRTLKTVADGIAMLRPVWQWGVLNGLLTSNPFSGMAPKVVKSGLRKREPFDDADAVLILKAARVARGFLRWLPWVLALTGCRIEEAAGASRDDIKEVDGVWCLDIAANAQGRSLKTMQSQRLVPLHPDLIAEGFVRYATSLPAGSPLFADVPPGHYGGRGEGKPPLGLQRCNAALTQTNDTGQAGFCRFSSKHDDEPPKKILRLAMFRASAHRVCMGSRRTHAPTGGRFIQGGSFPPRPPAPRERHLRPVAPGARPARAQRAQRRRPPPSARAQTVDTRSPHPRGEVPRQRRLPVKVWQHHCGPRCGNRHQTDFERAPSPTDARAAIADRLKIVGGGSGAGTRRWRRRAP